MQRAQSYGSRSGELVCEELVVPHFGKIKATIGRGEVVGYTVVQAGKQKLTASSGGETIDMWNYPIAVGWSGGGAGGDGGSRAGPPRGGAALEAEMAREWLSW